MAYWLLKTEPSAYAFGDLVKEGRAVWSGVRNPAALKHLGAMAKGDEVLFYHTGDEKAVVGTGRIVREAYADPEEKQEKWVVVDVMAGKGLGRPVTLGEIKGDPRFKEWGVVRIGRLSVVPTTRAEFEAVLALGKGADKAKKA